MPEPRQRLTRFMQAKPPGDVEASKAPDEGHLPVLMGFQVSRHFAVKVVGNFVVVRIVQGKPQVRQSGGQDLKSPPVMPVNVGIQAVFLDSGFRRNDQEGFIVRCDLLGTIARQKVLLRSERPVTDQAAQFESMVPATP